MKFECPFCGKPIAYTATFCPHCGASGDSVDDVLLIKSCAIMICIGIILISLPIIKTYNYISESINSFERKPNVWCGFYSDSRNEIKLFKEDVEKGGSSMCCMDNFIFSSWGREIQEFRLEKDGSEYNKIFEDYKNQMVVVEGVIQKDTIQIKNIKKFEE